jgi:hypothetical protein
MRHLLVALAYVAGALLALPAQATFHLFSINEAYSNASGTVQYVELVALAGGQQAVQGHTLTSSDGTTTRTFTLGGNLPGDTASGRTMLLGTAGVRSEFGIVPDFVIPDGFLHTTGTITWAEGSDTWAHEALPGAGLALYRDAGDGTAAAPTPQNFANARAPSYQALWWASPAGSENGWGINVAHQGDTLFVTWFTYDTDGSPMWLVMSDATRASEGVYSGALYRTTGPPFFNFTPGSAVGITQVGTASFAFTSPTRGTFSYSLGGVLQQKAIERQEFASPVPNCVLGGPPSATRNYQDLWWRSPGGSESGWGLNIAHQGDVLFATWFTYDSTGHGMWYVMSDGRRTGPETYTGTLYSTRGNPFSSVPWNSASVAVTPAGSVSLTFSDADNGTFTYAVGQVTQSKPITRQRFASLASVCGS